MSAVAEVGGHGGYDHQADFFSRLYLEEEISQTLVKQGLSGKVLTEATRQRVEPIWHRRQELNAEFFHQEEKREPELLTVYEIKLDQRDSQAKLWHPQAEIFLDDMLSNTERYARETNQPHLFNPREAEALRFLEQRIVNNEATGGLIPAWHPTETVRYFTHLERHGNRVTTRYTDVGLGGRDLTPPEAASVLERLTAGFGDGSVQLEKTASYPFLVFQASAISTDRLKYVSSSITTIDVWRSYHDVDEKFPRHQFIGNLTDTVPETGVRVARDVYDTIWPVGTLMIAELLHRSDDDDEEIRQLPLMERLIRRWQRRRNGETVKEQTPTLHTKGIIFEQEGSTKKEPAKRDTSPRREITMQQVEAAVSIQFVAETGVGVGAALWGLRLISEIPGEERTKRTKNQELRTKKILNKEPRTKRTKERIKRSAKENPRGSAAKKERRKKIGKEKEKRPHRNKEKSMLWKKRSRELLVAEGKRKKRKEIKTREKRATLKPKEKLSRLQKRLRLTLVRLARQMDKEIPFKKSKKRQIKERQENKKISLIYEKTPTEGWGSPKATEALVVKEPTQWFLLVIIWYLAQIKEQGKVSGIKNHVSKKKAKKGKKGKHLKRDHPSAPYTLFPQQGVIFAFVPAPIPRDGMVRDFASRSKKPMGLRLTS